MWCMYIYIIYIGFPGSSVGKKSACSAGDLRLIPGQEDPLEKEMAIHSSILAWKILWIKAPGGLQSMGLQELDTTWLLNHHYTYAMKYYSAIKKKKLKIAICNTMEGLGAYYAK